MIHKKNCWLINKTVIVLRLVHETLIVSVMFMRMILLCHELISYCNS